MTAVDDLLKAVRKFKSAYPPVPDHVKMPQSTVDRIVASQRLVESRGGEQINLFGFPILIDNALPPNTCKFFNSDGTEFIAEKTS